MVLAEIFSLLLYLVSLALLHEYFGKIVCIKFDPAPAPKHSSIYIKNKFWILHCHRLGIYLVRRIFVESICHHTGLMPAALHHQIPAEEVLTTIVF